MASFLKRILLRLFRKAGYEVVKISGDRRNSREGAITCEQALDFICGQASQEMIAARIFDRILADVVTPYHRAVSWGDRLLTLDKTAGFKRDPKFGRAFADCSSSTGQTQYSAPDGISWRLNTLIWAARSVLNVPGDFVECGVYKGDMSWIVSEMVDLPAAGKELYLYDTFDGFAPQYSSEADFPDAPQTHRMADEAFREPGIYEFVRDRFATKSYAKVIKGVVPDILREISPDQIALLHIDMNSAAPEIAAMELLFDRVSAGGIVIFDDYGWTLHRKQKDAHDAFMRQRGYTILELPTGQGLLIKH